MYVYIFSQNFLFILSEAISNFIFYTLNFFKMLIIFIVVTNKSPKVYNKKKDSEMANIVIGARKGRKGK